MSLILFDFDGVLADTLSDMLRFAQEVCAEFGIQRVVTPADLDALETMSFVEFGKQLGVPTPLADEFASRCLKKFTQKPSPPRIFDGMAQVIEQLSTRHEIGIVTGNTTRTVENFLVENGIHKFVGAVFAVDQPGTKSEKILKAQRQLAQERDEVYFVGDAVSDIQAARSTSVKSIAVGWGHQSAEKLISAEPDYLIHSPRELLEIL
jgi:phosphoglycolate phosphatase